MACRFVLTLSCPDRPGIVGAVGQFLAAQECNILESAQFGDAEAARFFMRVCFDSPQDDAATLAARFAPLASTFTMTSSLDRADHRPRTIVMVSRLGHCLNDLLYRREIGDLPVEIVAVVSNHRHLENQVRSKGLPYYHFPVDLAGTADAERRLRALAEETAAELIVLARYMRVLSPELCADFHARVINIHHSFLPGFKGARPYHQAFDQGVKLIGATAHYVTAGLDEGPIIEQEVVRVDHAMDAMRMAACGRDVENVVLARAVAWHAQRRVLVNGKRTIVFR